MNRLFFIFIIICIASCNQHSAKENVAPLKKDATQKEQSHVNQKDTEIEHNNVVSSNSENQETNQLERPKKSIIKNLAIDTTNAFGIWATDIEAPHADFAFSKDSFYIADYDGDGAMPYILDGNTISVYYEDHIQKGIINATDEDTLKIKWNEYDMETTYIRFE